MLPEMTEIVGFKDYFITKDGRVFSNKRSTLNEMTLKSDKDGYLEVGLYLENKRYFRKVHRLVAKTYIPNPNKYPQINHKNGVKSDNRVENLEWCTASYNTQHTFNTLGRIGKSGYKKPLRLEDKETGEVLNFNTIIDCSIYLGMSNEHLGRLLDGTCDISKSRKLKKYNVTLL